MFTEHEIKKASAVVKVATAAAATHLVDPYAFNAAAQYGPSLLSHGWSAAPKPGLLGSVGRSIGGMTGWLTDPTRAAIGLGPGNSMLRNVGSMIGGRIGGAIFRDPEMTARAKTMWNTGNWWAKPYQRAADQSSQLRGALPEYLGQHAPFFTDPMGTAHRWLKGIPNSGD